MEWSLENNPNHYFDSYSGLNFLLRCNYDLKFLEQTGMPQFYKSMLQFFHELKLSYETDLGQDLVLFYNKDILIDRKTFFYKSWFKVTMHLQIDNFLQIWIFKSKYWSKCDL